MFWLDRVPVVGGKALDLHQLFVEVTSRGGLEKVLKVFLKFSCYRHIELVQYVNPFIMPPLKGSLFSFPF